MLTEATLTGRYMFAVRIISARIGARTCEASVVEHYE
jgi:hypothetical protein